MIYILHPRDSVIEIVDKMLNCGDSSFGGAMYACPGCRFLKFRPHRCHSRFCPTCGNKYSIQRATSMSFKLIHCIHRHCVFTIPEELRHFFLSDRSLLNCLFLLSGALSCVCFTIWTVPNSLLLVLSVSFTRLGETWNGTLISTALFPRAALAVPSPGADFITLTSNSFALLSARPCWTYYICTLAIHSSPARLPSTKNTTMAFMCMPNPKTAPLIPSSNTLEDTLGGQPLPPHVLIPMTADSAYPRAAV